MPDEMFFSPDERGLVRGRRAASRTETCRPCVLMLEDAHEVQGVILNLNAHGLLVRVMEPIPVGAPALFQMMRDESFSKPLSAPRNCKIVRHDATDGTFHDIALRFDTQRIARRRTPGAHASTRRTDAIRPREPSRMQTLDLTLGEGRRGGRRK